LNKRIYLISIFGAIMVLAPYLIEKASAKSVTVNLTDKPFGDSSVWVEAKGPNGYDSGQWYTWSNVETPGNPTSGSIGLSLPDTEFPVGADYQICASSKPLYNMFPNCVIMHNNGEDSVEVPLSLH
jgi:hypothetical protein